MLGALSWFGARLDGPIRPPPLLRGQLIAADSDPPPFEAGDRACAGSLVRRGAQRWVLCPLDDGWLALRLDTELTAPLTRRSRLGGALRPDRGIAVFPAEDGWRWSNRRRHLRVEGALLFYGHERWTPDAATADPGFADALRDAVSP